MRSRAALAALLIAAVACGGEESSLDDPRITVAFPASVAVTGDGGTLAVGSMANRRVVQLTPDGSRFGTSYRVPDAELRFRIPSGLAFGADGSLHVVETLAGTVGVASFGGGEAGVDSAGSSEIGGERLAYPTGLAVTPHGRVFVADTLRHRVVSMDADGSWEIVAGSAADAPEPGFGGDGGPATEAQLAYPGSLALGPDGSLYIADTGNLRIRKVAPDGKITTVAGSNRKRFSGDLGPALRAGIGAVRGLAVAADGTVYFSAAHRVRAVRPDGTVSTVAGGARKGCSGDGGPAADASLAAPLGLAVGADGSLYVADFQNQRIRRVLPDGTIETAVELTDEASGPCT